MLNQLDALMSSLADHGKRAARTAERVRTAAVRIVEREARSIAKGDHVSEHHFGMVAERLDPAHPDAPAVRALARARFANASPVPTDASTQLDSTLAKLRAEAEHATYLTVLVTSRRTRIIAPRATRSWTRPVAPRAPAPTRLA